MNWSMIVAQIASTALFLGGMWLIFDRRRMQKLPEFQIPYLDIFANRAVKAVEQMNEDNPSKKNLAVSYIIDQYREYDLPIPSKATIGLAIEAAVLMLPKSKASEQ